MRISEIYKTYRIPSELADHQITVAAVAKSICDLKRHTDTTVIKACLLHDMGNIIKFKFDRPIPGLVTNDVTYWKEVQRDFIDTYGADVHDATMSIARELGCDNSLMELIDAVGFTHGIDTLNSNDIDKMIAGYSDMRVSPTGVTSLEHRLHDLKERYGDTPDRAKFEQAFREMEKLLFSDTGRGPEEITDSSIATYKKELASLQI